MNYLKLFENFNRFPDVFGDKLQRGVKMDMSEYIDDPQKRKVYIGYDQPDYRLFLENFKQIGLQDPTRSVHFLLWPSISMMNFYGGAYRVIPRDDSKFSFSRQTRNGGLGSTWYTLEKTLEDLNIIYMNGGKIDVNPNMVETLLRICNFKSKKELKEFIDILCNKRNNYDDLVKFAKATGRPSDQDDEYQDDEDYDDDDYYYDDEISELSDLFENDMNEFLDIITCYQKILIEFGLVGNLTYDELLKLSEIPGDTIQIWTESEVLHRKI